MLLDPRMPRDLELRGQLTEATTKLVAALDNYRKQKAMVRSDPNLAESVRQWCLRAIDAHADLLRAEREAGRGTVGPDVVRAAKERVDVVWRESQKPAVLVLGVAAEPLSSHATYLLALCKQEQAVRAQARADRAGRSGKAAHAAETKAAQDAWRDAAEWWRTFLDDYPGAPGSPNARTLLAWVREAQGQREAAVALLEDLSGEMTNFERTSRLYRAQQLKLR
jgi:hypothetical protein